MILSEVIMDVEVVAMDPCRGPGTPGPATHRDTMGMPQGHRAKGKAGSWWFWCWKIGENGCFEWGMMVNDDDILGISWEYHGDMFFLFWQSLRVNPWKF